MNSLIEGSISKRTFILNLFLLLFSFSVVSGIDFQLGIGLFQMEETISPSVDIFFGGNYFFVSSNSFIRKGNGIINFLEAGGKIDSPVSPLIGLGTVFGLNERNEFYFENQGIFFTAGILFKNRDYSISISLKEYMSWKGEFSGFPAVEILCRFMIGEW